MRSRLFVLLSRCLPVLAWIGIACRSLAAVPAAQDLLPAETAGFISTADWPQSKTAWKSSNLGRLWDDPSMAAFRQKFEQRFDAATAERFEKQLGIRATDLMKLARGQVTFALFRGASTGEVRDTAGPPWVLLVDAGDNVSAAKSWVDDTAKKMQAAKRTVKTTRIRDVTFQSLILTPEEFRQLFPGDPNAKPEDDEDDDDDNSPAGTPKKAKPQPKPVEVSFGVAGSALLIGAHASGLEKIVGRLKGVDLPTLASQERFQSATRSVLRGGQIQAWMDVAPFVSSAQASFGGSMGMLGADPTRIVSALGLDAVKWAALQIQQTSDGTLLHFASGIPQDQRKGIFKVLQPEAKDASPPGFVPRDAIKFQRWRINGPNAWKTLEDALNQVSPQLVGIFKLALESAGQQEDPNFSFKTEFVDRLGDDLITYEKPPKGKTLPELNASPSLLLLSSPRPDRLANGIRALLVMGQLQSRGGGVQVREFLGRKIYSARMNVPGGGKNGGQIHMSPGVSYVAISSDESLVEEFLRTTGDAPKQLKEFPGLTAAAEKVGGFNSGLFIFENQLESSQASWELLRKGGRLDRVMPPGTANLATAQAVGDWADFSLLPEFEKIARYFTFGVLGGSHDAQVLGVRWYSPNAR